MRSSDSKAVNEVPGGLDSVVRGAGLMNRWTMSALDRGVTAAASSFRARQGRIGAHAGPGEAPDRALGPPAVGGDRHRVHGRAARGEAVRGLQHGSEAIDKTRHPKIYIGKITEVPPEELQAALARLRELASNGSANAVRALLASFLPEAQLTGGATPGPASGR